MSNSLFREFFSFALQIDGHRKPRRCFRKYKNVLLGCRLVGRAATDSGNCGWKRRFLLAGRVTTGSTFRVATVADINREIIALWNQHFGSAQEPVRWPLICPDPVKNGLTVVGCNPAFPKFGYYKVPIFHPNLDADQQIQELAENESKARKKYRYYKPSHRLATELNLPLEHVDLFFYRGTEQESFQMLVQNPDGTLNDFGQSQIDLSMRLITLSSPKIILVANAFAARVFKNHFGLTKLDEDGLYWVNLDGNETPVFLSGMLSGGHLDNHTLERLVWHMKNALKIK